MRAFLIGLFCSLFGLLASAQQPLPTQAFVPQRALLSASFRFPHLRTQLSGYNLQKISFLSQFANWTSKDLFNQSSPKSVWEVLSEPASVGLDTSSLWHLVSERDSAGVQFYSLVAPCSNMLKWKQWLAAQLPRYSDSELKFAAGQFFIIRDNLGFIWNKSRVAMVFMQLPPFLPVPPSWLKQHVYLEQYINSLVNLPASSSLHALPAYAQADKTSSDLLLYFNPQPSPFMLPTVAEIYTKAGGLSAKLRTTLTPSLLPSYESSGKFNPKPFLPLLKNNQSAATIWHRFKPGQGSANSLATWLLLSPFGKGASGKLDSLLQIPTFINGVNNLNGDAMANLIGFKIRRADSLILPTFDLGLGYKEESTMQVFLSELVRNGLLKIVTPPNKLYAFRYEEDWIWYVAAQKGVLWVSTDNESRDKSYLSNRPKAKKPLLFQTHSQLVELRPSVFFAELDKVCPAHYKLRPLLRWLQTNLKSCQLYSSAPAADGIVTQTVEISTQNPDFNPLLGLLLVL